MARPDAILFDLDGTLSDRPATISAFANRFVHQFGGALCFDRPNGASAGASSSSSSSSSSTRGDLVASVLTAADGGGYRPRAQVFAHLRRALPWTTRPKPGALEAFWAESFPASARPAAGLHETLERLQRCGVRLGVVSNGGASAQRRKIDALAIGPYLSAVVISGAVGLRKPGRRIFDLALRAVGSGAAQTWVVGDHPVNDVYGARAAGLTAVWRRGAHPWPAGHEYPALHIDRLADLLYLLGRASVPRVNSAEIP